MNLQELLELLTKTEDKTRQEEILARHRELLNEDFIQHGINQVEAWTNEGHHEAAVLLADVLVTACTVTEELSQLRGKALFAKAKALDGMQRWDDTMAVYGEVQQLFEDTGDREGIADCDFGQGKIYLFRGDLNKALVRFQKAQTVYEELSVRHKAADCVMNQGEAHRYRGEFDIALAYYQQAQAIFEQLGMKNKVADCVGNQGNVHFDRGELVSALEHFKRAQAIFEQLNLKNRVASCIGNQGNIHSRRGEYDDALGCFKQAQVIFELLGMKDRTAISVMSRGNVHRSRGEFDRALVCLKQAEAIFEQLGIRHGVANCLINQGNVHGSCGNFDAALACFKQAQIICERLNIQDKVALCMMNQGSVHGLRREFDAALSCFKQAQAVFEQLNIIDKVALCEMNQGEAYFSRGEYDAALVCFEQAWRVYEKFGMKERGADVLRGKGDVYRLLGQHDAALQCYTQAKEERPSDQLWYPEIQWQVRYGIATLYQETPQALDFYDESLAIIDTLRGRQQTDWTKMGILHDKEKVCAEAIRWCLDRRKVVDYLPQAFNYAERAKARAMLDLMDITQLVLKSEDVNVQTHLTLLKQHQIEQQRLRETGHWSKAAELSPPLQHAQEELTELNFEDASLTVGRVREIETIQEALPQESALVEFYYQGETQVAFLLTKQGLYAFPLQLDTILPKLPKVREAIQKREPLTDVQATLAELFKVLFKPSGMWSYLEGYERLIIVPHGELHGVPFAALYDEERKQYLIAQKILSVVPSASILDVCRGKKRKNLPESCLWIYDPLTEYGKPYEGLSERFQKLQEVTGTEATIERITEFVREYPWDVVHFYCHAVAHPGNPMLSHIILSDISSETSRVAFLRAMDIFNLRLKASLVVLGACETAVGARRPGDDIISLTRAFFRAGTPSVLASLWRVPIRDTAALLEYFYLGEDENSGWLSGADKAVALQAAQRVILEDKPHPYYWAGFVLYGDWS